MVCPNCGAEIKRFDIHENCRQCGINLFYSTQEKMLTDDAKKCELEFAAFHALTAKLKTAFVGSKTVIVRLVLSVLCIAVLLIPFGRVTLTLPMFESSLSFGGIGLYSAFTDGTLPVLKDFASVSLFSTVACKAIVLIAAILCCVLASAAIFVFELLSFIHITKLAKALRAASAVGAVAAAASVVLAVVLCKDHSLPETIVKASFGFGGVIALLIYAANFAVNHVIVKKDLQPSITENDLKRIELHKKYKKGEVSLDDLELPIFIDPPKPEKPKKRRKKQKKEDDQA